MAKEKKGELQDVVPEVRVIKIRKTTTFVPSPADFETHDGVSMTIPDQSMSMRDIFTRFASGRPVDAYVGEPMYHGDDIFLPNVKAMDLVEIGQMLEAARENRELLEHQLETEQQVLRNLEHEKALKDKAEEDERLLKLYDERRANLRTNNT